MIHKQNIADSTQSVCGIAAVRKERHSISIHSVLTFLVIGAVQVPAQVFNLSHVSA